MEPTRAPRGLELEALVLAEKRSDVRARIVCGVGVAAVSLIGGLMASRASGSDTAGRAIAGTCSTFEVNVELQDPRTLAVHVCGVVLFVPTISEWRNAYG